MNSDAKHNTVIMLSDILQGMDRLVHLVISKTRLTLFYSDVLGNNHMKLTVFNNYKEHHKARSTCMHLISIALMKVFTRDLARFDLKPY